MLLELNKLYESVIEKITRELESQKKKKNLIVKQDHDGKTPLDLVIESGSSEAVKKLGKEAMKQTNQRESYNAFHHCSRQDMKNTKYFN